MAKQHPGRIDSEKGALDWDGFKMLQLGSFTMQQLALSEAGKDEWLSRQLWCISDTGLGTKLFQTRVLGN